MVVTPLPSSGTAARKYVLFFVFTVQVLILLQYGNCFTFILLGKRVTVTLGPQGNDYVLGGKHTQLAAEDVYSVRFFEATMGIASLRCSL